MGRADDIVSLGGRNVDLGQIEAAIIDGGLVEPGRLQAVVADGGYDVVVELASPARRVPVRRIRAQAVAAAGVGPRRIVVVGKGLLPRTSSGKPRRHETARQMRLGELSAVSVTDLTT